MDRRPPEGLPAGMPGLRQHSLDRHAPQEPRGRDGRRREQRLVSASNIRHLPADHGERGTTYDMRACAAGRACVSLAGKIAYDHSVARNAWRILPEAFRTGAGNSLGATQSNRISLPTASPWSAASTAGRRPSWTSSSRGYGSAASLTTSHGDCSTWAAGRVVQPAAAAPPVVTGHRAGHGWFASLRCLRVKPGKEKE